MKLLVVDDEIAGRKTLKIFSEKLGHEVISAKNGLDALQKINEEDGKFNLILLDINMPRINGVTTLQQLKSMDQTKSIPVIMCTSESKMEIVMKCIKLGAVDFIVKPFRKEMIAEKIDKFAK